MNCKPGDLAVIVKTAPAGKFLLGKVVHVLTLCADSEWEVRLYKPITNPTNGVTGEYGLAPDECLRPIRDPGDDATDETLTWLPVPSRERETV